MKRRNFLASLLALPFAAKPLEAMTPKPGIGFANAKEIDAILERLVARHRKAMADNTESVRQLTEAMQYAPTGFKIEPYRYSAADARSR